MVLDRYTYTYDRAGDRTSRDNELHSAFDEDYTYDGLDRLTDADRADAFDQSWGLDGLGNFGTFDDDGDSQTRTANAVNEITNITGGWISPNYDDAGNMISGAKPGNETTRLHHVYDAWNRQTSVYEDDGDGTFEPGTDDNLVAGYQYDGANRRIEKAFADDTGVEYFYNHDWQMLEERAVDDEGTATAVNQYVWSARYIDVPVLRFHDGNADGDLSDAGDNTRYYTGDANYNVTATIDAATGEVVDRYVYTAYGQATVCDEDWANPAAPMTDGPLYAGYFFDAESGLYQVRNRYYDSSLSNFVSRDPVLYSAGDPNLYRYCDDSPTNRTDPSGQLCQIAVHCWPVTRWGIKLGTHCGLTIKTEKGTTTIDGSGGDTIQLYTASGGGGTSIGTFSNYPDKTCDCLVAYVATFNTPKMPRAHLHGNSNWAMNCLVSHCDVTVHWGEHGAMGEPVGYDSPPCKRWEKEYVLIGAGPSYCGERCVEWYKCP